VQQKNFRLAESAGSGRVATEELAMAYAILRSQATDGYDSGGLTVAWVAQIRMKNFSNPGLSNWRIG